MTALRDTERLGEARWHNNAVFQLRLNRAAAIRYLNAMRERHPQTAEYLDGAIGLYEAVMAALEGADTGGNALSSAEGRGALIAVIEEIVDLEGRAADALEKAADILD
ncbi:hypothetical protein HN371_05200 [Candidatus Poribacteria bacterium]|jgi:hypothetical protein|nr:hypothetical protein [Candidatus Poribacteria bacterium]MBT5536441.1 hypothetical protein [Candidatus Poribacteria bacterium]MBT5709796.1 hypothetical protein [Candidatus Poribacteria bacterium]MBT7098449.1 hypothetical protein [Candidatus Poribacteria bacterium]MBT7805734.1 hypothetical protein [Candidatus Poribacteria bacterium]